MAYIMVDFENRVYAISRDKHLDLNEEIEIDVIPEEITKDNCRGYIYVNGTFHQIDDPYPLQSRCSNLKNQLAETDYVAAKIAESLVTGEQFPKDDAARYADVIEQRKQWRIQINELDAELENVKTQLAELNKTS